MEEILEQKMNQLRHILKDLGSVCIAFSGGVDSTFLTKVSREILGDKVLAVTAVSPAYPKREVDEAKALAVEINVRHLIIESGELEIPEFYENRADRCYYCKSELFNRLTDLAHQYGIKHIIDGSNYDDIHDYRPGMRAAKNKGVRSPLLEAGLTKKEIRVLSHRLGLRTWNKPSFACLSSRIPYNTRITAEKLEQVEKAEEFLRELGLSQFRVRHHNEIARIETLPEEFNLIIDNRITIAERFRNIGFKYISLDITGYRTGAMNEVLK